MDASGNLQDSNVRLQLTQCACALPDQISSLLSYARNTLNAETEPLRQMLDLPEDYEDLTF